ncbi:RHS repeat-associated core domain-containing protein [Arthrobacter alpinus]|uniref:RHS repeat-associated core domain-containing protein n=1 Tax=Arthrobacter alpinus TaxID=656366 RepID=UPI000941CCD7
MCSLPVGLGLPATGGLSVAGLDWLGARAHDPSSRGFLSTDPLPHVVGAGWDGNPHAYVGNNPLGMVDPTGLRPITDQDLKA